MLAHRETLTRDHTVTAVHEFIRKGGFRPGDRLPAERELTVSLGINRTTLRKALDVLERNGTIWRHVGKGTFVAAPSGPDGQDGLAGLVQKVTPVHMMRARLSLEPAIAWEAAINASDAAVTRIRLARDRAAAASTWEEYEAQDDALHRTIAEATGNILLLALFDQLNQVRRAVAWNTVVRYSTCPPSGHSSFAEHERITAAVEARDPAAAQSAMRKHLGSVSARLFGEL